MKKRSWSVWTLLFLLSFLVFFTGCDKEKKEETDNGNGNNDIVGNGNYTQTELQELLDDESVTEIRIEGEIGLNRPLTVSGNKTLTGTGTLIMVGDAVKSDAATALPNYVEGEDEILTNWKQEKPRLEGNLYVFIIKDGAELTLTENVNLCANYAGENCLVEEGGSLVLKGDVVLEQAVNSNIVNEGTLTVAGGSIRDTSGYHVVNYGKMLMEGGEITGSGSGCAAVFSTGTVAMSGGILQQSSLHGFYLAAGSMEISGGQVTACEKDGIFVDKDAELTAVSSALKVTKSGRSGVMNLGTTTIDAGRFITAQEADVKNAKGGRMIIKGGNFTDSNWAGIYNCGEMEIHGGNISTNKFGGIVNTGTLVMDGGALYANSGSAQLVNRSGNMKVSGQAVSITSGKGVGIANDMAGVAEVSDIIMMDQQAAHIRNLGEIYLHDMTLDNNAASSAVYNDCNGRLRMERVEILESNAHGLYNVAGATAELTDVTIREVGSRGIQNKGGTVTAKNLTVDKSKGVSVGNDYDKDRGYGDVTIDGLSVGHSYSGALINQCAGTMTVTNATIQSTEKTAIKIEDGRSYLSHINLKKTVSTGKDVTHAIFLEGGYLKLSDSTISNPTGCILQNKAGTVEGYNLVFNNSTNVAISNAYSAQGKQSGSITITGLIVNGSASGNLANACDGKTTLKNATLNSSEKTNISASKGSVELENVAVNGLAAEKSPCINIYGGATVTVGGDQSLITGGNYRAVSVGSSKEEGTFILNGGTITGNGNETVSQYGGGVNVGQLGVFVMNGGVIENNVGRLGEQLYLATNAQAVMNGGRITGRSQNQKETVRLGGNNASLGLSGDAMIGGVVRYNQSSAYIKVLGNLTNTFVIEPLHYNVEQQVLKADDSRLLEANHMKFFLLKEDTIYCVGAAGYLAVKDGIPMVARNQKTGQLFASLQDAVLSAPTDGTRTGIELIADVKLDEPVIVDKGRRILLTDDGTARMVTRGFTSEVNNRNMMFYIYNDTTLELEGTRDGGLTIRGLGEEDKTNASHFRVAFRVGVKAGDGARLVLNDHVTVTGHYAQSNGGAALVYGTVEMNGGAIRGNKTAGTGGVFQMAEGSAMVMNGGTIEENYAGSNGGAIRLSKNAEFTMNGGTIRENESAGVGGAVFVQGKMTIHGGTVASNQAAKNGGAIQLADEAEFFMDGGTISGNVSKANGGAIHGAAAVITITGGTISDNTAARTGGNLNIGSSKAEVFIGGGTLSGGKVGKDGNDVNLCDGGTVSISGDAALGIVRYGTDSGIRITGALGRKPAAILYVPDAYEDLAVLAGTGELLQANYGKFELADLFEGAYRINEKGVLELTGPKRIVARTQADGKITEHVSLPSAIRAIPEKGTGTITLVDDVTLYQELKLDDRTVTLTDDGTERTIARGTSYSGILMTVGNNASLTMEGTAGGGLVMDGGSTAGAQRMITVGASGANTAALNIKEGVTLQNNLAGSYGGSAIYVYGTLNLSGGTITGNTTTNNGIICIGGTAKAPGTLVMTEGTISGNTANNGGAISVGNYTRARITGGTISGNTARTNGGGIQVYNGTLELGGGAVLSGNTAGTAGGNLNIGNRSATVTVKDQAALTDGRVKNTSNDVNITAKGLLGVGGNAALGNVSYDTDAKIQIVSALTGDLTASISLKTAGEGTQVLTGTAALLQAHVGRFELAGAYGEAYVIDETGKLASTGPGAPVARTTVNGTTTEHTSLDKAIEAIPANGTGTVTLLDDVTLYQELKLDQRTVTITDDGQSRTILRDETYTGVLITVGNRAELTLEGTSSGGLTVDGNSVGNASQMIMVGVSGGNTAVLNVKNNVTLQNNTSNKGGSAIYSYGRLNLSGGTITGNTTTNNGIICIGGTAAAPGSLVMTGGTISGNTANNGGAISVGNYTSAEITGGTISGNTAKASGGGIQVYNGTLELGGEAVLSGNTAGTAGGNLNIGNASARVTVKGNGALSGGRANGAANDVNIIANGTLNVGENAVLGNVSYGANTSKIQIASALTKDSVATIKLPAAAQAGDTVLTATGGPDLLSGNYTKFALADSQYVINGEGKLEKPEPAITIEGSDTKYETLQDAIDAIPENGQGKIVLGMDVVLSNPGLAVDHRRVIITDDGQSRTILRDGAYTGALITVGNTAELTLEGTSSGGLTVDGNSVGNASQMIMVGVSGGNTAVLNVKNNVTLQNNTSNKGGAAIYSYGRLNLSGGTITGNTTTNNGIICIGGTAAAPGSLVMTGGTISGNTANNGGAISVGNYTSAEITGGTISGNTAKASGGGIQVYNGTLELGGEAVLSGNTAGTAGGNLNIGNASARVTVKGNGALSGGRANGAANDVNIIANGTLNVGENAVLGNVTYGANTSKIQIASALTKDSVATIKLPAAAQAGNTVLTATGGSDLLSGNYMKFALSDSQYVISEEGKLVPSLLGQFRRRSLPLYLYRMPVTIGKLGAK